MTKMNDYRQSRASWIQRFHLSLARNILSSMKELRFQTCIIEDLVKLNVSSD
jgi:hypothetical protein